MDKIKSAREIALEKVAGLGKASPEEMEQIRQRESVPIGQALAARYLSGEYPWREVESRIARAGDAGDIVARSLLASLVESLGPGDNSRALEGIESLASNREQARLGGQKVVEISQACRERRQRELDSLRPELEQSLRRELEDAGISGTAVQVEVERSPRWRQTEERAEAEYRQGLARAKKDLLNALGVQGAAGPKEKA